MRRGNKEKRGANLYATLGCKMLSLPLKKKKSTNDSLWVWECVSSQLTIITSWSRQINHSISSRCRALLEQLCSSLSVCLPLSKEVSRCQILRQRWRGRELNMNVVYSAEGLQKCRRLYILAHTFSLWRALIGSNSLGGTCYYTVAVYFST